MDGVRDHKGQQQIHFPDKPWDNYVAVWGRRTGKTIAAAMEAISVLGMPNTRTWIVAPTYELTDRVFEYVWRQVVVDKIFGMDSVVKSAKTPNNRYIELRNGSFIKGKSGESPDSLIGEQLDFLVLDEAARLHEDIWNQNLRPTLVDRKGRALFISTPVGYNWFRNYYLRGTNDPEGTWQSSNFATRENPFIDRAWLNAEKSHTPEIIWDQEYEAKFTRRSGLIWPEFVPEVFPNGHLYDPTETHISDRWRHLRAIDIGWKHPTGCLWGAVDYENNLWIYQEYLETGIVHEDHISNIKALTTNRVSKSWISPDAKKTNPLTSSEEDRRSVWDLYRLGGIYASPASNDVGPGLGAVARYFRATLEDSPTHPKILISKNCPQLIEGILNYIFKKQRDASEEDMREDGPERPRKYQDEMADCLRYMCATKPVYYDDYFDGDEFNAMENIEVKSRMPSVRTPY